MNDHKRTDFNVNDILGKNESKQNNTGSNDAEEYDNYN